MDNSSSDGEDDFSGVDVDDRNTDKFDLYDDVDEGEEETITEEVDDSDGIDEADRGEEGDDNNNRRSTSSSRSNKNNQLFFNLDGNDADEEEEEDEDEDSGNRNDLKSSSASLTMVPQKKQKNSGSSRNDSGDNVDKRLGLSLAYHSEKDIPVFFDTVLIKQYIMGTANAQSSSSSSVDFNQETTMIDNVHNIWANYIFNGNFGVVKDARERFRQFVESLMEYIGTDTIYQDLKTNTTSGGKPTKLIKDCSSSSKNKLRARDGHKPLLILQNSMGGSVEKSIEGTQYQPLYSSNGNKALAIYLVKEDGESGESMLTPDDIFGRNGVQSRSATLCLPNGYNYACRKVFFSPLISTNVGNGGKQKNHQFDLSGRVLVANFNERVATTTTTSSTDKMNKIEHLVFFLFNLKNHLEIVIDLALLKNEDAPNSIPLVKFVADIKYSIKRDGGYDSIVGDSSSGASKNNSTQDIKKKKRVSFYRELDTTNARSSSYKMPKHSQKSTAVMSPHSTKKSFPTMKKPMLDAMNDKPPVIGGLNLSKSGSLKTTTTTETKLLQATSASVRNNGGANGGSNYDKAKYDYYVAEIKKIDDKIHDECIEFMWKKTREASERGVTLSGHEKELFEGYDVIRKKYAAERENLIAKRDKARDKPLNNAATDAAAASATATDDTLDQDGGEEEGGGEGGQEEREENEGDEEGEGGGEEEDTGSFDQTNGRGGNGSSYKAPPQYSSNRTYVVSNNYEELKRHGMIHGDHQPSFSSGQELDDTTANFFTKHLKIFGKKGKSAAGVGKTIPSVVSFAAIKKGAMINKVPEEYTVKFTKAVEKFKKMKFDGTDDLSLHVPVTVKYFVIRDDDSIIGKYNKKEIQSYLLTPDENSYDDYVVLDNVIPSNINLLIKERQGGSVINVEIKDVQNKAFAGVDARFLLNPSSLSKSVAFDKDKDEDDDDDDDDDAPKSEISFIEGIAFGRTKKNIAILLRLKKERNRYSIVGLSVVDATPESKRKKSDK